MQYKIISIEVPSFNNKEEELNLFLRTYKIVSVSKELVCTSDQCYWSFCIQYIEDTKQGQYKSNAKVNYQELLSEEDFKVYEEMRALRNSLAKEMNILAYAVFTNDELSILCKQKEITKQSLLQLDGFGEGRYEKTGRQFINKWYEAHH